MVICRQCDFQYLAKGGLTSKTVVVVDFYRYLHDTFSPLGIPISSDLFGVINVNPNETKTLGQNLHAAPQHFDCVAPVVYPSHFYAGTAGYENPVAPPSPIITYSMGGAEKIATEITSSTDVALSTLIAKLRPWYQDFDVRAAYTAEMVRAQINAGVKRGIKSWTLWDSSNKYNRKHIKSALIN